MNENTMRNACILTYAGILPFFLLSLAVVMKTKGYDYDLALRAYGVAIISFLCGTHWAIGLLFSDNSPRNLLLYSNVVTLVAWGSLLSAFHRADLIVEALCLTLLLKLDHELLKQQLVPVWYFNLRLKATLGVVVLLIIAAALS